VCALTVDAFVIRWNNQRQLKVVKDAYKHEHSCREVTVFPSAWPQHGKVFELPFRGWGRRSIWSSIAVLRQTSHEATCCLRGCVASCMFTSAIILKPRGSVAITLSAHGRQGASYLSWQSIASLCTRLKRIGGDAPALNFVVRADDRQQANSLKHGDQWH
jgi:hypothetical protein